MPLGTPVIEMNDGTQFFNWDKFKMNGEVYVLGVNRDGEDVKLYQKPDDESRFFIPDSDTEIVSFSLDEFESKLGDEIQYLND